MENLKTSFAVTPFTFDNGAIPQEVNVMHNGEHTPLNDAYNYAYRNSVFNLYAGQINGQDDIRKAYKDKRTVCSADVLRDTIEDHLVYLILDTINRMELAKYYTIDTLRLNNRITTGMIFSEAITDALSTVTDRYGSSDMEDIEKNAFNLSNGESFLECVEVTISTKLFLALMTEGLSSQDATAIANSFRVIFHPGLVALFNNIVSVYTPILSGYTLNLQGGK